MGRLLYVLLVCIFVYEASAVRQIKIGALFDGEDESQEWAFKYAVDEINSERVLLPRHRLIPKTETVAKGDSFAVNQAVCGMLKEGVVGIFGPTTGSTSSHVQSVCDSKEVPHVETRMDPLQGRGSCLINIYPYPPALSRVFVDIVREWKWKTFTILYENSESFSRISELLKMYDNKGPTVSIRQLDLGIGDNFRPILIQVKKSGETNYVLDCSLKKLPIILIQAQQVGIMSDQHNYLITNPDMHTIDMEAFQYGGANITGIRLLDPEDSLVEKSEQAWNSRESREAPPEGTEEEPEPEKLRSDAALMIDAVTVFASGLREINATKFKDMTFDCADSDGWEHGFTMINYMKTNYVHGLTRGIKFDHSGFRSDFLLDIIELTPYGIQKIGTWNSTEGLNITRIQTPYQIASNDGSLINMTFLILTALSDPYGMLKEASIKLEGNDRFEGFGIELIDELSKMLGFNYTFQLQGEGGYGSLNRETGEWSGMVRNLLDYKADLAITDLTITSDRESAVDFTMPFMNLGISILYQKPTKQPPLLFSFMSPFSNEVWLFLGTAYMGVSVLIFVMARISPDEWQNPYPCIQEPDHLENQFSMANSLWFTVGSVLQQGSELAPISSSTRMIAGVWWFFTLIIVSSYTANLAAFLTVESIFNPIESAEQLAYNQYGIVYGAKRDGSTLNFFRDAEDPVYKKMYEYMMSHPEALTGSNSEGLQRVKNENYAYLMESTSIQYIIERECLVTQIGGLLDDKGYGIAMRKNSPYRNTLSTAVLKLQEQGKLESMKRKWWKEKRGGGACSGVEAESGALPLSLENVGGVFVVLVAGCFGAIFITIFDLSWEVWNVSKEMKEAGGADDGSGELGVANVGGVFIVLVGGCVLATFTACGEMFMMVLNSSIKNKVPFRQEMMAELRFVAKCSGDTKPVRHRRSSSPSSVASEDGSNKSDDEGTKPTAFGFNIPDGNAKLA